jgi:16S rRNA (guanine527-N7)-methyltransferase
VPSLPRSGPAPDRTRPALHRATPAFDRTALAPPLRAGLDALGLDRTLAEPLLDYLALLVKWNAVYNLTAVRDPAQMLVQHLLDSLAVVPPLAPRLPRRAGLPGGQVVDVGSGGGLPGIVLAMAWPRAEVLLVEPVGKKAAFLRQCQAELALTNIRITEAHVESLGAAQCPAPDLIICRAFASLADYVAAIDRLAGPATTVAAMKGTWPADEIAALPPAWTLREALPLSVPDLDATRHLLLLQRASAQ